MRIGRTLPSAAAPLSVKDLLNGVRGIFSGKKEFDTLKSSICNQFACKHCFLVSSGKAAISLLLETFSEMLPERKQVIIPAFNCYSVPSAIIRAGFIVRPCEIEPSTFQFQENALLNILKDAPKILAIIPTHFFGLPAHISNLKKIVANEDIPLIEDAAQVMGNKYEGEFLGTNCDAGIFSLARGKVISCGDGGIIVTNRSDLATLLEKKLVNAYNEPLTLFKQLLQIVAISLLIHPSLFWLPKMMPFLKIGETIFDTNFPICKLSGFQAGLLREWQKKLSWLQKMRSIRFNLYSDQLSQIAGTSIISKQMNLRNLPCIRFPLIIEDEKTAQHIMSESDNAGLGISKTYPDTVDSIFQMDHPTTLYPNAQKMTRTLLTLPCHPLVNTKDIARIIQLILFSLKNIHNVQCSEK